MTCLSVHHPLALKVPLIELVYHLDLRDFHLDLEEVVDLQVDQAAQVVEAVEVEVVDLDPAPVVDLDLVVVAVVDYLYPLIYQIALPYQ